MRTQQNENKIYWPGNVFLATEWFWWRDERVRHESQ